MAQPHTPAQTIGPFFRVALDFPAPGRFGARAGVPLEGRVLDGADAGVGDALVELWDGRDLARCHSDASPASRRDATSAIGPPELTTSTVPSAASVVRRSASWTRCEKTGNDYS